MATQPRHDTTHSDDEDFEENFVPSKEFVEDVVEWDKLSDTIKKYESALKKLRKEKLDLQLSAVEYMDKYKFDTCNLSDGKIMLKTRKVKANNPLTRKSLPGALKAFLDLNAVPGAAELAKGFIPFMDDQLVKYEDKHSLTRTKTKSEN